jgi:hypothetical protein
VKDKDPGVQRAAQLALDAVKKKATPGPA